MKDILHLLMVPFTGLGNFNGYRGDKWFAYRIEIFKKFVVKSLMNQTNKDFVLWLCFRPEEETNPLTVELEEYLKTTELRFIFTYGGVPIWDDKFKYDNLLYRLKMTLPMFLGIKPGYKPIYNNEKYVYETCQPSDDFYHPLEVEEIQKQEYKERRILTHSKGYVFNHKTQRVADWNPTTINPPFYTIMYPAEVFFNPQKHFDYMRNSRSHEDVAWLFDQRKMSDPRYCVSIHGNQISTTWYHPYREHNYTWEEGRDIMRIFGIEIDKPSMIKYGLAEIRMILRYWFYRLLIKGHLYRVLKFIKNKYENYTRSL